MIFDTNQACQDTHGVQVFGTYESLPERRLRGLSSGLLDEVTGDDPPVSGNGKYGDEMQNGASQQASRGV